MNMKKKVIVYILIILMIIFSFNIKSYAITLPELIITSNNYSDGDKITFEESINIEEGKTLQLYAILGYGNDEFDLEDLDSRGWFVEQVNLEGVTWTSEDTSVATIDSKGKLTGIKEGKTTITAKYPAGETEGEKETEATINVTKSKNQPSPDEPEDPNKTEPQTPGTTTPSTNNNNLNPVNNGYSSIGKDETVSNVQIPKTGLNFTIITISIIGITLVAIFSYKKYRKYTKYMK